MKLEQNLWMPIEEDFHKWIEDPKSYPKNELTNFRKSIHIFFRRKYHSLLTSILKKVYEDIPPEFLLQEEDQFTSHAILSEPEEKSYDLGIRFRIVPDYERENRRILSGLWKDDFKTISNFYENEFSKIASLILKNNGTVDDAKDVFQDAMVILMDKFTWGKLDLINCSLGTYLYSISRNLWHTRLREMKKEKEFVDMEQHDTINISTDYYHEEPDDFESVNRVISNMGNPCKELLELFYFENQSYETIASVLGYSSAASARNQKYKCLERIRKRVLIRQ